MELTAKEEPFSKFCTFLFGILRGFVSHSSFPWIPWDMSKGSSYYGDYHNLSKRIGSSCCVKGHLLSVKIWEKMQRCLWRWGKSVHLFYMLNSTKNITVLWEKFKCRKKSSKTELQTFSIITCFMFIWINYFQLDLWVNSRAKSLGKYDVNVYMLIDIFNQLLGECFIASMSLKTKCSTGPSCSELTL